MLLREAIKSVSGQVCEAQSQLQPMVAAFERGLIAPPLAVAAVCTVALTEPLPEECLFDAHSASSELRTTEGKRVVAIARGPSATPELHAFILQGLALDEKRKLVRELAEVFVRNLNVAPKQ